MNKPYLVKFEVSENLKDPVRYFGATCGHPILDLTGGASSELMPPSLLGWYQD